MIKKAIITLTAIITTMIFVQDVGYTKQTPASMANIKAYIVQCATEMGVEPEIALSIAKVESGFSQNKKSRMGAVGVFQLLPSTARRVGYNPYHYKDNIRGGIAYYKQMKKIFKTEPLALAAYNAGPGNVKKYGGIPPFAETRRYVKITMKHYNDYKNNPDPTVSKYLAAAKIKNVVTAEKEHREVLTLFMLNQAI